ncbi:MAG: hypothetical protein OEY23_18320, partial [Acidimicrobiia bacterium]|nr:hypothetical protein [Acidimicrobiia bacterium]
MSTADGRGVSRRSVLRGTLLLPAARALSVLPGQALASRTYHLHRDTAERGQRLLYTGGDNANAVCDTAAQTVCPGPGRLHAYWGGLYVDSVAESRLRTGPFSPGTACGSRFRGPGAVERLRWTTTEPDWRPEYRFTGRIRVLGISADRPKPYTGLTLHPIHLDNCNNYYVRLWRRDDPTMVDLKRERGDDEEVYLRAGRPGDIPPPALDTWHTFRIDVLPGTRFRFSWNGKTVFDVADPDPM